MVVTKALHFYDGDVSDGDKEEYEEVAYDFDSCAVGDDDNVGGDGLDLMATKILMVMMIVKWVSIGEVLYKFLIISKIMIIIKYKEHTVVIMLCL